MKTFYALIDANNGTHFGYTFNEERARKEAVKLEDEHGVQIDVYEFKSYEEF